MRASVENVRCSQRLAAGAGASVTSIVYPATVSTPVRGAVPVLFAARNDTTPFPVPLDPDEMVSQAALLAAVHGHPDAAVTFMDAVAPVAVPVMGPSAI